MEVMIHPTHARTTRIAMIIAVGIALVALAATFYVADETDQSSADLLCVGTGMLGFVAFLLVFISRAYVCRCPQCKPWLSGK